MFVIVGQDAIDMNEIVHVRTQSWSGGRTDVQILFKSGAKLLLEEGSAFMTQFKKFIAEQDKPKE